MAVVFWGFLFFFFFVCNPAVHNNRGGRRAASRRLARLPDNFRRFAHVLEVEGVSRLFMYTQGALSALCMYRDVHTGR